ncbi:MAG: porin [Verrucomicrobiota bacterium]|nr:porin [Verrucomicrobiota bacterium]
MEFRKIGILIPLLGLALWGAPSAIAQQNQTPSSGSTLARGAQSFNPDISVIVDMCYHADDSEEGISHLAEEMSGFGHAHSGEEGHHHGPEAGLNLRHLELQVSANVDPYFKGSAIAAISLDGAEMETAEMETTALPYGLKLRGGKFFSDFGYINAQHSHQWDFTDQPLIHKLCLGDHGLNDKGLQLSWLAPTPFYLLVGAEAFQGENETMFAYSGEDPLPSHDGPRLGVAWLKASPDLPGYHAFQAGIFGAIGKHQEAHDGNGDGTEDHWLDGDNSFWGGDFVYKHNAPLAYGEGDVVAQGGYFSRRKDLELVGHDLAPQPVGNSKVDDQDGYYVQAVYGLLPRWRTGLRREQVGLINRSRLPDGMSEGHGSSSRWGAMLDFTPSEFSRLRLQVNQGSYETAEGQEDVAEVYLQWTVSIGAHGAHKF